VKKLILVLFIFTIYIGFSSIAVAQETGGSQFGLVYGYNVPDADNTNPHQIFGIKGSAFLKPNFSIGGYYLIANKDEGSGGREFEYSLHGLEATYHTPTNTGDTFFGFRVGLTKVKTDSNGEDVIFSPYHFGFAAGYDHFLASWVSVGFEGSYTHVQKSETTKNTVQYEEESFSTIQFLLSLQIRL